jgi:hypothetical protein
VRNVEGRSLRVAPFLFFSTRRLEAVARSRFLTRLEKAAGSE